MATPDFVLALREKIGHDPLWLTGVTAIVLDADRTHLLVVRRRDTGAWTPVTGIIDPGEEPAVAGAREVREETAVRARPVRLVDVRVLAPLTYANGDTVQYLDLCFRYEYVAGIPYPADGENSEARWARLDDLPPLNDRFRAQLELALSDDRAAAFCS